jgi:hypothetical protein
MFAVTHFMSRAREPERFSRLHLIKRSAIALRAKCSGRTIENGGAQTEWPTAAREDLYSCHTRAVERIEQAVEKKLRVGRVES